VPGESWILADAYRARVEQLDGRRVAELRVWPPDPLTGMLDESRGDVGGP